jgi:hypothetical protein
MNDVTADREIQCKNKTAYFLWRIQVQLLIVLSYCAACCVYLSCHWQPTVSGKTFRTGPYRRRTGVEGFYLNDDFFQQVWFALDNNILLCCIYIPLRWTAPWWWHLSAETRKGYFIIDYNCILFSARVGWCKNFRKMHSMSNIKDLCLLLTGFQLWLIKALVLQRILLEDFEIIWSNRRSNDIKLF